MLAQVEAEDAQRRTGELERGQHRLRDDSALALASSCADVTGEQRVRDRVSAPAVMPIAGSSTLNRLELGEPKTAKCHRYKKIVADSRMIDTLLVDLFLDSERRPPGQVVVSSYP